MAQHEVKDEFGNKMLLDDKEYGEYMAEVFRHKFKVWAWMALIGFTLLGIGVYCLSEIMGWHLPYKLCILAGVGIGWLIYKYFMKSVKQYEDSKKEE